MRFLVTGGTGFIGERVVKNLVQRGIAVVCADWNIDPQSVGRIRSRDAGRADLEFVHLDVSDFHQVMTVFHQYPDMTHVIHLAYLMSAECEANPLLGVRVNLLGMTHLFEACLMKQVQRLIFTSSETVYGGTQQVYGQRPVREDDFCSPADHFFTYGMMKILNEFMAGKYISKHGLSIGCTRPPVVFGHGRKHGSALWAADFASLPAVGKDVLLPFAPTTRDCWIYVEDCAEQLVRLALKPQLSHFAYNCGGETVSAAELAGMVRHWTPAARIDFDLSKSGTPLIDEMDGTRLANEIEFRPRPLLEGIRAHINEARAWTGLPPLD